MPKPYTRVPPDFALFFLARKYVSKVKGVVWTGTDLFGSFTFDILGDYVDQLARP